MPKNEKPVLVILKSIQQSDIDWQIRHAALMVLQYVLALQGRTGGSSEELQLHAVDVASQGMGDDSHDVRGAASRVWVQLLKNDSLKPSSQVMVQLWEAFSHSNILMSSSLKDFVNLLSALQNGVNDYYG